MTKSIRFENPVVINVKLVNGQAVPEKIAAVEEMLRSLGSDAVFEHSRIVVELSFSDTEPEVDFHISWPRPQLNNQHFSSVKLLNWTVGNVRSASDARLARDRARDELRARIEKLANGALAGRIDLMDP